MSVSMTCQTLSVDRVVFVDENVPKSCLSLPRDFGMRVTKLLRVRLGGLSNNFQFVNYR